MYGQSSKPIFLILTRQSENKKNRRIKMHKLFVLVLLLLMTTPVLATGEFNPVPLPSVLPLLGIGALAYLVVRIFKK